MEFPVVNGVVFNEVDFARNVLAELCELTRVLEAIVEILEDDEFERRTGSGLVDEMTQRLGQHRQIVRFVDGHDVVPLGIVGRVQTERQIELHFIVPKTLDGLGDASRGDGDSLGRHCEPWRPCDAVNRLEHVPVIQQRLAHAHVHDVGQPFFVLLMGQDIEHLDLIKHVPRREVLQKLEPTRRTKFARQAAPHLGADACRQTLGGGDQDPFHDAVHIAVDLKGTLDRAVFAVLRLDLIDACQRKRSLQLGTKPFAQGRHVLERTRSMRPQPLFHLLAAKRLLAHFHERTLQCLRGKGADVWQGLTHEAKIAPTTRGAFMRTSTGTNAASALPLAHRHRHHRTRVQHHRVVSVIACLNPLQLDKVARHPRRGHEVVEGWS